MNDIVNLEGTSLAEQKEYNDKLFRLFGNMVNPLSALEHLFMVKRSTERELELLEESNIKGKVLAVCLGGGLLIGGVWLPEKLDKISFLKPLLKSDAFQWIILLFCIAAIVGIAYSLDKKYRESKITKKKEEMDNVKIQIDHSIKDMKEQLQFIPPSYCNSDAMRYFARAYIDGKVANVKEAMISYDEYTHRQNMENGQFMMIQQQGQILANQAALQQQLSYDTAMIMLSNFVTR